MKAKTQRRPDRKPNETGALLVVKDEVRCPLTRNNLRLPHTLSVALSIGPDRSLRPLTGKYHLSVNSTGRVATYQYGSGYSPIHAGCKSE